MNEHDILDPAGAAQQVMVLPGGALRVLGGIDSVILQAALDRLAPDASRPAVALCLRPAPTPDRVIVQAVDSLAEAALRLWPFWWRSLRFIEGRDTLAQLAAAVAARQAAREIPGVSSRWAEAAARRAAFGHAPRIAGYELAQELSQLARVLGGELRLLVDVGNPGLWPRPEALVHALEWIAAHADAAVVALFPDLPALRPPFDRILYNARMVTGAAEAPVSPQVRPTRGLPHPLSDTERRLVAALAEDGELGPLFEFNRTIFTTRGSTPRVDLVWRVGQLVVEVDGYGSHGNRQAFRQDRHRDYELALTGFTVLRVTNDEIDEDLQQAVEKIRDMVRQNLSKNDGGVKWR